MNTLAERHEADQDDADRYAQRSVLLTSQRAHIAELKAENERLRVKYNAALGTIERRTSDRNHPYGDVAPTEPAWHSSTSQCVRCLHPGEVAT